MISLSNKYLRETYLKMKFTGINLIVNLNNFQTNTNVSYILY